MEPYRGFAGVVKPKFAQVWPREMCHRICIGIEALIRHRGRARSVHDPDAVYPVGRGRFRENPFGIASEEGVIYDCPACMRRLHKYNLGPIRKFGPPSSCKFYNETPKNRT